MALILLFPSSFQQQGHCLHGRIKVKFDYLFHRLIFSNALCDSVTICYKNLASQNVVLLLATLGLWQKSNRNLKTDHKFDIHVKPTPAFVHR